MIDNMFAPLINSIKNHTFQGNTLSLYGIGEDDHMQDDPYEHVLTNEQTIELAGALQENNTIDTVNLTAHFIEPTGIIALANVESIINLSIASNRLWETPANHNDYIMMIEALTNNIHITSLDLGQSLANNPMQSSQDIAKVIQHNNHITHLSLCDNHLLDSTLEHLSDNHTITSLNISRNNITNIGAQYIAQNNTLQQLEVSHTQINDEGADYLAHSTIINLRAICTKMTIDGIRQFIGSPTLQTIQVDNPGTIASTDLYNFYQEFETAKLAGETTL